VELIEKLGIPEEGKTPLRFTTRFPQSYLAQYKLITHRNFVSYYRNSSYNCTRFIFGLILGFLFGSTLWNIGTKRYPPPLSFTAIHCYIWLQIMPGGCVWLSMKLSKAP